MSSSYTGDKVLDKVLSEFPIEDEKKGSAKIKVLLIRAPGDRGKTKKNFEARLKAAKIKFVTGKTYTTGGTGDTDILLEGRTIRVGYKHPVGAGGASDTTLNSTITELAPLLAFSAGYRYGIQHRNNIKDESHFVQVIETTGASVSNIYLTEQDKATGLDYINRMRNSAKVTEKFASALGVLKYLSELDKDSSILRLYWAYRSKPKGVDRNHKGDIFVALKDGSFLGVSIKASASGKVDNEPQFNTFVSKLFTEFNDQKGYEALDSKVYKEVHAKIGLPRDWKSNLGDSAKTISAYRKKYPAEYDTLYDKQVDIVKAALVARVNKDMEATKAYIQKNILSPFKVPLVVIKGAAKNYHFISDEETLKKILPKATQIRSYPGSSKQDWFIDIQYKERGKTNTATMKMSVRTSKSEPFNKIAQGTDLAVKFNGLKK